MALLGSRTHWATQVADAVLTREAAAAEQVRGSEVVRTELERGVESEGHAFVDRIDGEVRAAADAVNHRLGHQLFDVRRSPTGVSIRSRDDGALMWFVAHLENEDPDVIVTAPWHGRERVDVYLFVLQKDHLHLLRAGVAVGAEQFVRAQLEPWLATVPLGGR